MVTTNSPIITLRDVRFTYDGGATWALDGVSLDIRRGERICLTGPNGSGKSTLSRVIAGLVAPDEGYVALSGNVVFDESGAHADEYRTARCGIGAVFQHPEDQIVTTVTEDDVAFGPENLAIEHDEIGLRISGSLDAVDMSDYRASNPTRMSGGQQQRIAIAGMLAMDSDVLVLDEPTAMLDPRGRREVMETIHKLNREYGITVVLITHYMDEAAQCDRIIVMDSGKVILDDTPKKVFSHVRELKKVGLDVPQTSELIFEFLKEGYNLPKDVLTEDECVKAITTLFRRKGIRPTPPEKQEQQEQ